jgi:hypothetical protein
VKNGQRRTQKPLPATILSPKPKTADAAKIPAPPDTIGNSPLNNELEADRSSSVLHGPLAHPQCHLHFEMKQL